MSMLKVEQVNSLEDSCKLLQQNEGIRFAGIINNKGRLIAGGFKEGLIPHESDERRQMLYMELALDLSMRKGFDNSLGSIHSIISRRDKVNIITVPFHNNLLLISTEPNVNPENIVDIAQKIFNFTELNLKC